MFLLAITLLLLFVSCLFDVISAILILAPLLLIPAVAYGIDPMPPRRDHGNQSGNRVLNAATQLKPHRRDDSLPHEIRRNLHRSSPVHRNHPRRPDDRNLRNRDGPLACSLAPSKRAGHMRRCVPPQDEWDSSNAVMYQNMANLGFPTDITVAPQHQNLGIG